MAESRAGRSLPRRSEPLWKGWLRTGRRILARPWTVIRSSLPTFFFDDLTSIDPGFIDREGVRTLLWDVDGTLMAHHASEVDPALADAFRRLRQLDVAHAIVSNCGEARFRQLQEIFPGFPIVIGYLADRDPVFRIGLSGSDRLVDGRGVEVAEFDSSWDLLRKPDARLVHAALGAVGSAQLEHALLVGDQHMTDIASAGMAGVRSVKVRTVRPESFPFINRVGQFLERLLIPLMGRGASAS